VRHRAEYLLLAIVAAFAVAGAVATALDRWQAPTVTVQPIEPIQAVQPATQMDAQAWFGSVRQYCNPVEVETRLRWQPAPPTHEGRMHEAACYALAGRIESARSSIEALPSELRYQAAGVVFGAGHPAADAGDDIAAGPLMELVVDYWPNHYMALYHAGAARFETGSYDRAQEYLERFLVEYEVEDGWRSNALSMLEEIGGR
jgi:tetratricopeptide (TPR) repeat protein